MIDAVTYPARKSEIDQEIARAQAEAKVAVLEQRCATQATQLAAIFDGIARGEQVDLQYPDGQVVPITKARRRNAGEPET